MKKINKLTFSLIVISVISTISIGSSASAYALGIQNPLTGFLEQWQKQLSSINKYVQGTVSSKLNDLSESLQGDLQAVINESVGAFGLPDATETRKKVEEIVDSGVNSVDKVTNEIDRQITRASSNTTLSKEGQEVVKEQIEETESSLTRVKVFEQAAQNDVVTQNVMKRISQQNTEIVQILGAMKNEDLKSKQSQDLANLNLTNISRSIDGQNQARQRELLGQSNNNLLRSVSQARLF
ncbi:MAG: hypothetical protein ACFB02_00780 [Mastigocoleus sp.]